MNTVKVILTKEYYNYFGGQRFTTEKYSTLADGWKAYKHAREHLDFQYDDAWHHTTIRLVHQFPSIIPVQRPHARGEYEWLCLQALQDMYNDSDNEDFFIDDEILLEDFNIDDIDYFEEELEFYDEEDEPVYIPRTIIESVLNQLKHNGSTFVLTKDTADYFAMQGYNVSECNTGFLHWLITE